MSVDRAPHAKVPVFHVQHHHATDRRMGDRQDGLGCVDTTCRRAISLGFDVTLVSDAHTTLDGELPAESIIRHHNAEDE